ncbi:MAG: tail fiber domain-containing protein [Bacteroidia bacterium]
MKLKSYMATASLAAGLLIGNSANAQWLLGGNSPTTTDTLGNKTNQDIKIITNNKVQVYIKKTGYVGIGNVAPKARLDVWGYAGTAAKDTVPAIQALVKYAGTAKDVRGVYADASTYTSPGYGIGVEANGGAGGVLCSGGIYGIISAGGAYGAYCSAVGIADTTTATGYEADGVDAIGGSGNVSIGVYAQAGGGRYNYGCFAACGPLYTSHDSDNTHKNWAGYFLGDLVASRLYQFSDAKLKTNIQPFQNALDKLSKVQTSTYTFKSAEYPQLGLPTGNQIGFIAENMETVFPNLVREATSPKINGKDAKLARASVEFKAVNYEGILPVVVAAINEQKQIIDQKDAQTNARIAQLEKEVAQLKAMLTQKVGNNVTETGSLMQNVPNPANGSTTVTFSLPENSKGVLQLTDVTGKLVKTYNVSGSGMQQVVINTASLSSGSYTYSLSIDGKVADSKTMMISK